MTKEWMLLATKICKILVDYGFDAHLVGGGVRDLILFNNVPHDIDIATNATPNEINHIFSKAGYRTICVGAKFGTVKVILGNETPVEITTYRSEGNYEDRRHPSRVVFEDSLTKDLERRDFTINAMAYNPITGTVIDPFGGRSDADKKIIRCVGNPIERFDEDPLRMMRLCRFVGKYGFHPEKDTLAAAFKSHGLIREISSERIFDELMKILGLENPEPALNCMMSTCIMHVILPEVARLEDIEQPRKYHAYDALTHTFVTVVHTRNLKLLRFASLLHDIGKIRANPNPPPYFPDHIEIGLKLLPSIFDRFKVPNMYREYVTFMVKHHMDDVLYNGMRTVTARRYLSRIGKKHTFLSDLWELMYADVKGTGYYRPDREELIKKFKDKLIEVLRSKTPLSIKDLVVNGNDLMEAGIKSGPKMGIILQSLLSDVIKSPKLNTREYLLERAKDIEDCFEV